MTKEFVLKDESGELRLVAGVEKTDGEEPVVVLTVCAPNDYIARSISLDEAQTLGEWLRIITQPEAEDDKEPDVWSYEHFVEQMGR